MEQPALNKQFQEAYQRARDTSKQFPPDLLLQFYAYYKRATEEDTTHIHQPKTDDGTELVSAFKMNSLFQIKDLSREEAKKRYIDLVNEHVPKEK